MILSFSNIELWEWYLVEDGIIGVTFCFRCNFGRHDFPKGLTLESLSFANSSSIVCVIRDSRHQGTLLQTRYSWGKVTYNKYLLQSLGHVFGCFVILKQAFIELYLILTLLNNWYASLSAWGKSMHL